MQFTTHRHYRPSRTDQPTKPISQPTKVLRLIDALDAELSQMIDGGDDWILIIRSTRLALKALRKGL